MKKIIKPVVILSALIGAIMGILILIPIINVFICLIFSLIGAGIVVFLKQRNLVGVLSVNDGAFIGAISGAVATISATIIYVPMVWFLGLFIKSYGMLSLNAGASFVIASYNIIVIAMLVFFLAMLNALFNSFSALIATYIYEKIEEKERLKDIPEFTIDQ